MKLTQKNWLRIREILRQRDISPDQIKHINCLRFHPTETKEHRDEKYKICCDLYEISHPFLCEVWTTDHKKRLDILDLEDNIDIEVETGNSKNKVYKGDKVVKLPK